MNIASRSSGGGREMGDLRVGFAKKTSLSHSNTPNYKRIDAMFFFQTSHAISTLLQPLDLLCNRGRHVQNNDTTRCVPQTNFVAHKCRRPKVTVISGDPTVVEGAQDPLSIICHRKRSICGGVRQVFWIYEVEYPIRTSCSANYTSVGQHTSQMANSH